MAKFCTNCGNELAENAAMCVKCGNMVGGNVTNNHNNNNNSNGGKKKFPVWAIILIVIGGILLFFGFFVGLTALSVKEVMEETGVQLDDIINTKKEVTGTIGDTLSDGSLKITLTKALKYNSLGSDYYVKTPAEGKEYLVLFFDIENVDDETEYVSTYDFDGYVDSTAVTDVSYYSEIEGLKELSTNLATGMKTSGFVIYEVPKGWKNFEAHYEENSFDDDSVKVIFKVVNSNDSESA